MITDALNYTNWDCIKFYSGESISDLVYKSYKAMEVLDCSDSKISIEEYTDIALGICKFKYMVYNYDISPDELYVESEVSFMTLFDFIKDNNLYPIGTTVKEFIIDDTRECLKYYILHQRKN